MSEYRAPLQEMRFALRELASLEQIAALPGCEEATPDVVDAVLDEAARFATEVLSPLNVVGDRVGARWQDKAVTTAPGFSEAYRQFVDNGWNGLACDPVHGGQGLPTLVGTAVNEMWKAANHAFSLCPMLTQGAIEALNVAGSMAQKDAYLPKLVSGEWTGTMNLTEPQAGSDLAAVRTRAEPQADGSYKLFGQKIFITYGEHDMAENIVHFVLARAAGAPEGVKGISLFLVPKFLVNGDGSLGARNDVYSVSIEHKLGIHGSPTSVMAFGDNGGAIGYPVGELNRGLEYMFIMMNAARFNVGLEGLGDAERAYQRAVAYARDRIQGTEAGVKGGGKVAILRHPDVRRLLLSMRARVEAMRAVAYVTAAAMDVAHRLPEGPGQQSSQAFVDLMIPLVKGWSTETAIAVASDGVQVHGGMGYIEETGAAQHLRDARITAIYEGTTAIQANDLVGRKIARDQGETAKAVIGHMRAVLVSLKDDAELRPIAAQLAPAIDALEEAVHWVAANYASDVRAVLASAVPFLNLFGLVAGGWQMARAAWLARQHQVAGESDAFWQAKLTTSRFYADHYLTQAPGLAQSVITGAGATLAMPDDAF